MSHRLWKYYCEDDIDGFRRLLAPPGPKLHPGLSRAEVNSRDHAGLTVLLRAASSTKPVARDFVKALLDHPSLDLFAIDGESGWNALHRSLYNGNVSIAWMLLTQEQRQLSIHTNSQVRRLISARDHEGKTPFDVYNSTVAARSLHPPLPESDPSNTSDSEEESLSGSSDDDQEDSESESGDTLSSSDSDNIVTSPDSDDTLSWSGSADSLISSDTDDSLSTTDSQDSSSSIMPKFAPHSSPSGHSIFPLTDPFPRVPLKRVVSRSKEGNEAYVFGSNRNHSLGVGDAGDRQFLERVNPKRPAELLHRFHEAHISGRDKGPYTAPPHLDVIPTLILNQPLKIEDISMSKYHSAIVTSDPFSNLYVTGMGRGGRLGLGHEDTQFSFVPVRGPLAHRTVRKVALGLNHTMAIVDRGELWTWGSNTCSQLGYRCNASQKNLTPRRVIGSLKKEIIIGVAASAVHSVAHTRSSLYCWGLNTGQLDMAHADSSYSVTQNIPFRVAAAVLSSPIQMVSAIDRATICLLQDHTVWVFTNYSRYMVDFASPDPFQYQNMATTSKRKGRRFRRRNFVCHVASGDQTIAALTVHGDLFTAQLCNNGNASPFADLAAKPAETKSPLSEPQWVWDSCKDGVAAVSVGENGSVIICTKTGAVWRTVERATSKFGPLACGRGVKKNNNKFERVPYITNCVNVRSSEFGAFAAIRRDCDIMTTGIEIAARSLCSDIGSLICLSSFRWSEPAVNGKVPKRSGPWDSENQIRRRISSEALLPSSLAADVRRHFQYGNARPEDFDMTIWTTAAPELKIPVHSWLFAARSPVLRAAFSKLRRLGDSFRTSTFKLEAGPEKQVFTLLGLDVLTLLNVVVFAYQDSSIQVWKHSCKTSAKERRYCEIKLEITRLASELKMYGLAKAADPQISVTQSLRDDMTQAFSRPGFFDNGDLLIKLNGSDVRVHSSLVCQRCPFFKGMLRGRSQGRWLSTRRQNSSKPHMIEVDLGHINPQIFDYVLEYLYTDAGTEMFSRIKLATIDELSEITLDVMSVANELMLDRLSQICQAIIANFVTTQNVAKLLNEISPCSVTDFKRAGLEFICLQLECMLDNHLLDELDEDLFQDLDETVRSNQLEQSPYTRSGEADRLLHEKYPHLAHDIEEERRLRLKEMLMRQGRRNGEKTFRAGALTEGGEAMPLPDGPRHVANDGASTSSPVSATGYLNKGSLCPPSDPLSPKAGGSDLGLSAGVREISCREERGGMQAREDNGPWASSAPSSSKLGLKEIMLETTAILTQLSGVTAHAEGKKGALRSPPRMSQKERKRHFQQLVEAEATSQSDKTENETSGTKKVNRETGPWKAAASTTWATSMQSSTSPTTQQQGPPSLERNSLGSAKRESNMREIIGQQEREQALEREATVKRSLQEIQVEQAFEEWWDKESRRVQEEARRVSGKRRDEGQDGNR